jgi:hypothetical protein
MKFIDLSRCCQRVAAASLLIFGVWLLTGCRSPASMPADGTPPLTDAPPPTDIPTPANTRHASFQNISFDYEASLAKEITGSRVPGYSAPGFPGFPEYVKFDLPGYPTANEAQIPRIEIYPVDEYIQLSPDFQNKAERLKQLLAEKPAMLPGKDEIPVVIFSDLAQVIHAQVQYLSFQNGYGLRFITMYAQDDTPITNTRIFYVYQGFTNDGRFYVIAILPVFADILPDVEQNLSEQQQQELLQKLDDFAAYVEETTQQLDDLQARDFAPNLNFLDALIQSLIVK